MPETAVGALAWLTEMTSAGGTDWALGIEARLRALLGSHRCGRGHALDIGAEDLR